jgi:2-oxoglutarate ferredoxin oxidoreductase subunit alpha
MYVDKIVDTQETYIDDAEVVVISYGVAARAAGEAVAQARNTGLKAGSLKLNTVWPFPEKRVIELAKQVKAFIVPEMNFGQVVLEVERCSNGKANVFFLHHGDNGVECPDGIIAAIKQASQTNELLSSTIELK